ncbi:MAG: hypothetical protein GY702_19525 [Desulfobulbaceae bacterium]|nr:hypothetical protein [Desulfobulbaceae bacterium]
MKNFLLALLPIATLAACGPQPDHLKVHWIDGGDGAEVSVISNNTVVSSHRIECGTADSGKLPFQYEWEPDCDLDTTFNGNVHEWDNPADIDSVKKVGTGVVAGTALLKAKKKAAKKKTAKKKSYKKSSSKSTKKK